MVKNLVAVFPEMYIPFKMNQGMDCFSSLTAKRTLSFLEVQMLLPDILCCSVIGLAWNAADPIEVFHSNPVIDKAAQYAFGKCFLQLTDIRNEVLIECVSLEYFFNKGKYLLQVDDQWRIDIAICHN